MASLSPTKTDGSPVRRKLTLPDLLWSPEGETVYSYTFPQLSPSMIVHETLNSLDTKVHLIPGLIGDVMLCTTEIGTKRFPSPTSDDFDLRIPRSLGLEYNYLHDPHLRDYLSRPHIRKSLRQKGFITEGGLVKCSPKEFNEFRQSIRRLKVKQLEAEFKEESAAKQRSVEEGEIEKAKFLMDVQVEKERKHSQAKEIYEEKLRQKRKERKRLLEKMELEFKLKERSRDYRQEMKTINCKIRGYEEEQRRFKHKANMRTQISAKLQNLLEKEEQCLERKNELDKARISAREEIEQKAMEKWRRRQCHCLNRMEEKRIEEERETSLRRRNMVKREEIFAKGRRKREEELQKSMVQSRKVANEHLQKANKFLEKINRRKELEIEKWRDKYMKGRSRKSPVGQPATQRCTGASQRQREACCGGDRNDTESEIECHLKDEEDNSSLVLFKQGTFDSEDASKSAHSEVGETDSVVSREARFATVQAIESALANVGCKNEAMAYRRVLFQRNLSQLSQDKDYHKRSINLAWANLSERCDERLKDSTVKFDTAEIVERSPADRCTALAVRVPTPHSSVTNITIAASPGRSCSSGSSKIKLALDKDFEGTDSETAEDGRSKSKQDLPNHKPGGNAVAANCADELGQERSNESNSSPNSAKQAVRLERRLTPFFTENEQRLLADFSADRRVIEEFRETAEDESDEQRDPEEMVDGSGLASMIQNQAESEGRSEKHASKSNTTSQKKDSSSEMRQRSNSLTRGSLHRTASHWSGSLSLRSMENGRRLSRQESVSRNVPLATNSKEKVKPPIVVTSCMKRDPVLRNKAALADRSDSVGSNGSQTLPCVRPSKSRFSCVIDPATASGDPDEADNNERLNSNRLPGTLEEQEPEEVVKIDLPESTCADNCKDAADNSGGSKELKEGMESSWPTSEKQEASTIEGKNDEASEEPQSTKGDNCEGSVTSFRYSDIMKMNGDDQSHKYKQGSVVDNEKDLKATKSVNEGVTKNEANRADTTTATDGDKKPESRPVSTEGENVSNGSGCGGGTTGVVDAASCENSGGDHEQAALGPNIGSSLPMGMLKHQAVQKIKQTGASGSSESLSRKSSLPNLSAKLLRSKVSGDSHNIEGDVRRQAATTRRLSNQSRSSLMISSSLKINTMPENENLLTQ